MFLITHSLFLVPFDYLSCAGEYLYIQLELAWGSLLDAVKGKRPSPTESTAKLVRAVGANGATNSRSNHNNSNGAGGGGGSCISRAPSATDNPISVATNAGAGSAAQRAPSASFLSSRPRSLNPPPLERRSRGKSRPNLRASTNDGDIFIESNAGDNNDDNIVRNGVDDNDKSRSRRNNGGNDEVIDTKGVFPVACGFGHLQSMPIGGGNSVGPTARQCITGQLQQQAQALPTLATFGAIGSSSSVSSGFAAIGSGIGQFNDDNIRPGEDSPSLTPNAAPSQLPVLSAASTVFAAAIPAAQSSSKTEAQNNKKRQRSIALAFEARHPAAAASASSSAVPGDGTAMEQDAHPDNAEDNSSPQEDIHRPRFVGAGQSQAVDTGIDAGLGATNLAQTARAFALRLPSVAVASDATGASASSTASKQLGLDVQRCDTANSAASSSSIGLSAIQPFVGSRLFSLQAGPGTGAGAAYNGAAADLPSTAVHRFRLGSDGCLNSAAGAGAAASAFSSLTGDDSMSQGLLPAPLPRAGIRITSLYGSSPSQQNMLARGPSNGSNSPSHSSRDSGIRLHVNTGNFTMHGLRAGAASASAPANSVDCDERALPSYAQSSVYTVDPAGTRAPSPMEDTFPSPAPRYQLSETDCLIVLKHIGSAVAFMHARGLAHLDVKPANILVTYEAGPGMCDRDGEWLPETCVLNGIPSLDAELMQRVDAVHCANGVDSSAAARTGGGAVGSDAAARGDAAMDGFGAARDGASTTPSSSSSATAAGISASAGFPPTSTLRNLNPDRLRRIGKLCYKLGDLGLAVPVSARRPVEGDSCYLSRELLNGDTSLLQASDIFSLGLSVYELASGLQLPREGDEYSALRDKPLPRDRVPHISHHLYQLLCAMVVEDQTARPSAHEIIENPLVKFSDDPRAMSWYQQIMSMGSINPAPAVAAAVLTCSSALQAGPPAGRLVHNAGAGAGSLAGASEVLAHAPQAVPFAIAAAASRIPGVSLVSHNQ